MLRARDIHNEAENPALNVEVARWCHLVRVFSFLHPRDIESLILWNQVQKITNAGSGITIWRVLEDHELPDVKSVGQPLLDEL